MYIFFNKSYYNLIICYVTKPKWKYLDIFFHTQKCLKYQDIGWHVSERKHSAGNSKAERSTEKFLIFNPSL